MKRRARGHVHWLGWLACCVAFVTLVPAASAEAQRRTRETKQEDKAGSQNPAYRALIEEAVREFDLGNWNEALALFQKAHAVEPNARTLRGIGFCLFENRRYVDAMRHLEQALVDTRSPLSPSQRSSTQQVLERASAFVTHVSIHLSPSDAHLLVDGKETPLSPSGALLLDPGEHELSASAAGYTAHALQVTLQSGQNDPIRLDLSPVVPQPAPIASGPVAPAREHESANGQDRRPLKRGLMSGGFALAGVGLVTGAVTGVLTLLRKNELEESCPDHTCPTKEADKLDNAKTLALVSSISFGVAAVGAGIALTGLLLPNGDKRTAQAVRLRLSAGPTSLSLSGAF
jgi:hypothetical protein